MATVSQCTLGVIHGKIGSITFRQRKGTLCAYALPVSYSTPMDTHSVAIRKKFTSNGQLAKAMTSIPALRQVWHAYNPRGHSAYNTVITANARCVLEDSITERTLLLPSSGIPCSLDSCGIATGNCSGIIQTGSLFWEDTFRHLATLQVAVVLVLRLPYTETVNPYALLPFVSAENTCSQDGAVSFSFPVTAQEQKQIDLYRECHILAAVLLCDARSNVLRYSNTCRSSLEKTR
jgi:hypothetical protein